MKKSSLIYLIITLGLFLRVVYLNINPPGLTVDEVSIGYNAYSILKTGRDEYGTFLPFDFKSLGDYKPPLYIYLTAFSEAVFGLNEFAVRFPAALLGTISIIFIYYFLQILFLLYWSLFLLPFCVCWESSQQRQVPFFQHFGGQQASPCLFFYPLSVECLPLSLSSWHSHQQ